ncbi:sulfotransferase domain-containing protein [Psychromarinibacter sp. S121]|uniref:sulfotransferase domain-containing protein n=1 Tax=Psychromarinibacter sp. S121 TaxID=3415127 RepID=UPI003C7E0BD5
MDTVARKVLPQTVRNLIRPEVYLARRGVQKLRQLSGQTGRLPDFLILGAQKAGTTTLYDLIMRHPGTAAARTKEISYFDRFHRWGPDWYRSNFPDGTALTGEATPCYLFVPEAARRIADTLPPTTRFIVLLRDPVDRAISHYFHERRLGYEPLTLAKALDAEPRRTGPDAGVLLGRRHEHRTQGQSFAYVGRGRYAEQLKRYFALFPRENFLIETSDRFFAEPLAVLAEVHAFLGLPPHTPPRVRPRNVGVYAGRVPPEILVRLSTTFAPENARLADLLNRPLPW